jgi:hypothetical protein
MKDAACLVQVRGAGPGAPGLAVQLAKGGSMANATIQFTRTDDYILVPSDHLQLTLRALPPARAALDIAVYSAAPGHDGGYQKTGQASIDNLANAAAAPQYRLPLTPGFGYAFRLAGEASLLLPGVHSMTVGLVLGDAAGRVIHDFGDQTLDGTHALLDGLFYVKMAG